MIKYFIGLPIIVTTGSFLLNAVLAVLLTMTYTSLTKEQLIATITFDKNEKEIYTAHLYDDKDSKVEDYTIYGDQWRMDAGFIKMKYWANIFGIDSKYVLDRIEGRYSDIEKQNNNQHKSYQIESSSLIDTMSFFVDTTYGSSVYKDIKLNTKYIVLRTQTGLMVRESSSNGVKETSLFEKSKAFVGF